MGNLHGIAPHSVGLADFGKAQGFYDRQLRTLGTISATQASTLDVETGKPVGDIPHSEETIGFLKTRVFQPEDRSTFIHGDFKVDNLVYHKTKPHVIGVLE